MPFIFLCLLTFFTGVQSFAEEGGKPTGRKALKLAPDHLGYKKTKTNTSLGESLKEQFVCKTGKDAYKISLDSSARCKEMGGEMYPMSSVDPATVKEDMPMAAPPSSAQPQYQGPNQQPGARDGTGVMPRSYDPLQSR